MQRNLGVTLIAAVLGACGSQDRQDAVSERTVQRDTGDAVAMDTAGGHEAHSAVADPQAVHGASPTDDAHAGHGAPAGGASVAAVARDAHGAHTPTSRAQQADPHAAHARSASTGHAVHTPEGTTDPASSPNTAAGKLALLMDALLSDSAVVQRIRQDPELQEMWLDPRVRSGVRGATETTDPMARLLDLVRALTADPAVQQHIREDPSLRHLQSQPGVRQRIQPPGQP